MPGTGSRVAGRWVHSWLQDRFKQLLHTRWLVCAGSPDSQLLRKGGRRRICSKWVPFPPLIWLHPDLMNNPRTHQLPGLCLRECRVYDLSNQVHRQNHFHEHCMVFANNDLIFSFSLPIFFYQQISDKLEVFSSLNYCPGLNLWGHFWWFSRLSFSMDSMLHVVWSFGDLRLSFSMDSMLHVVWSFGDCMELPFFSCLFHLCAFWCNVSNKSLTPAFTLWWPYSSFSSLFYPLLILRIFSGSFSLWGINTGDGALL